MSSLSVGPAQNLARYQAVRGPRQSYGARFGSTDKPKETTDTQKAKQEAPKTAEKSPSKFSNFAKGLQEYWSELGTFKKIFQVLSIVFGTVIHPLLIFPLFALGKAIHRGYTYAKHGGPEKPLEETKAPEEAKQNAPEKAEQTKTA